MRKHFVFLVLVFVCAFTGCNWWPFDNDQPVERVDLWWKPFMTTRGTPAVDDSSLYVIDLTRTLYRLNRSTGAEVWRRAASPIGTPRGLARAGNMVVMSAGEVVAVATNDGSVLWRVANAEGVGELESTADANRVYPSVYRGAGDAVALDAATGGEVWRGSIVPSTFERSSDKVVRVFEPEVQGNDMIATFMYWSLSQPELPNRGGVGVVNATDGRPRWSKILPVVGGTRVSTFPSRVAVSATVVAASTWEGYVFAYDRATGDSLWTGSPLRYQSVHNAGFASPDDRSLLLIGGTAVVGSGIGTITGFDARTGAERWVTPTKNGAVVEMDSLGTNQVLILHLNSGLTLIDCKTGSVLWSVEPLSDSERFGHVVVSGDTVFGISAVSGVKAFRLIRK